MMRPKIIPQSLIVLFSYVGISTIAILFLLFFGDHIRSYWELNQSELELIPMIITPELNQLTEQSLRPVLINIGGTALLITLMTALLNASQCIKGSILRSLIFALLISGVSFLISGAILVGVADSIDNPAVSEFRRYILFATYVVTGLLKAWLPALAAVVAFHAAPERAEEPDVDDAIKYPGRLKIKWREDLPAGEAAPTPVPVPVAEAEMPETTTPPKTPANAILGAQFLQSALNASAVMAILIGVSYASNLVPAGCSAFTIECIQHLSSSWIWPVFLLLVTLAAAFGAQQIGSHHKVSGAVGLSFFIALIFVGTLWALGLTTFFEETLKLESWIGILLDLLVVALASASGAIMGYHVPRLGL